MDPLLEERRAWVAWSRMPGLGGRRLRALWERHGSLARAWRASALEAEGLPGWGGAALAARAEEHRRRKDPARAWREVQRPGMRIVALCDADYPAALLALDDPPPVLYLRGRWPLPEERVAIVGTRRPSGYGRSASRRLARELASFGACVVSGGAEGIDTSAHEGALESGCTAAVLGGGLDHLYPASNLGLFTRIAAGGGCLLTEYPPDVKPSAHHFPYRNRLIAALAEGVIVAQGDLTSGTRHTVEAAQALGREVLAVPGPITDPGSRFPHRLLQEGAGLVGSAEDVLAELGWRLRPPAAAPEAPLSPQEARLFAAFDRPGALSLDRLALAAGLGPAEAGATLGVLVLKGLVLPRPGGRYERA